MYITFFWLRQLYSCIWFIWQMATTAMLNSMYTYMPSSKQHADSIRDWPVREVVHLAANENMFSSGVAGNL